MGLVFGLLRFLWTLLFFNFKNGTVGKKGEVKNYNFTLFS